MHALHDFPSLIVQLNNKENINTSRTSDAYMRQ